MGLRLHALHSHARDLPYGKWPACRTLVLVSFSPAMDDQEQWNLESHDSKQAALQNTERANPDFDFFAPFLRSVLDESDHSEQPPD